MLRSEVSTKCIEMCKKMGSSTNGATPNYDGLQWKIPSFEMDDDVWATPMTMYGSTSMWPIWPISPGDETHTMQLVMA